jgi:hypothetical protein
MKEEEQQARGTIPTSDPSSKAQKMKEEVRGTTQAPRIMKKKEQ